MRITDIKAYNVLYPLKHKIQFSWEPYQHDFLIYTIIEVSDEEGFKGYSAIEFGPAYKAYLEGTVRMILQNIEFDNIRDLSRLIEVGSWIYMRLGPLETAIWDLIGRKEDKPIYKLIGGGRKRIKVYASMGRLLNVEKASKLIEEYIDLGIDLVKIRLRRNDINEDIKFAADANQAWSIHPSFWDRFDALKIAEELYSLGFEWIEEPLYKEDLDGLRWLREKVNIPIAFGELEHGLSRFKTIIKEGLCDIVQSDAVYGNGITESLNIASLADASGLKYIPHAWDPGIGWLHNLHLASSLPENLTEYIETPLDPEWWFDTIFYMVDGKPEINDGYVEVPDGPGLGFKVDFNKLKKSLI